MEHKFLENKSQLKSGRIFCVWQVYKFLPINLGACKPFFNFFLYTTSEEKEYYEALIIQTLYKMQYFTIFEDKLHSFNTQDHRSTRGLLISETVQKNVQNHIYGQPVLTFDKRQICEEILKELLFNVITNFLLMVL